MVGPRRKPARTKLARSRVKPLPTLKIMVASTVYNFEDQLNQICAILRNFGYEVWNSHLGTVPLNPHGSNLDNCLAAVRNCDLFLGIIRPFYGSGRVGERSITHEEALEAVRLNKPRWFLVHRDVTFARQLLKAHMFTRRGQRTKFKLKKSPVMDDLRVIDIYNDVIQSDVPRANRKGHWAQEFFRIEDVFVYLDSQFKEIARVRRICDKNRKP